jgi:photosystem II stability/assembly factor-like uncharacterized protein
MKKIKINQLAVLVSLSIFIITECRSQPNISENNQNKLQENIWKVIGPGGGGGVLKPTVSPFDENFVLTHCDMTGAYISHDGGKSWKMKNLWNVPDDFEFDPVDNNTIYIATRGFLYSQDRGSGISLLLRSSDKGEKWRIIFPDVSKSKKVERLQSTNIKPSEIIDGALDGTIQKIKVDPADNKRIYIGLAPLVDYMARGNIKQETGKAKLVMSSDRGITWKVVSDLPGKNVLAIFPERAKNQIIVFTESSCISINDITGETKNLPLPVNSIIAVEGGKSSTENLIYIQTVLRRENGIFKGGIYVSADLGVTWKQSNEGLLKGITPGRVPDFRQGMAVCGSRPEVAYISTINPVTNQNGQTEEIYCIFKTVNAGKSWEPVLLSSTPGGYITKNFKGSWMEESFDPGWGGSPIDLGVAPGNPDVCYAGDNGRGYRTLDGGKTWEQVYCHNNPDGSYSNTGLNVTTCYGVHFDPFDKNHFFICYTDMGLFHTFNGGNSWFHSIKDIPRDWQNTCYQVTFDPEVKGKVWSVWADAHDLPRTKMFGGGGFSGYHGGIALSSDAGLTWQKSNSGMSENSVSTNILVDPSSPVESRTLYVSVFEKGIYKSSDGGKSWNPSNSGLGNNLFTWQLRQNAKGRLFALFARGESRGKVVDGAVYYSDDKAASWKQLPLPEGINGPHDLLIDPVNPEIMYICCWPRTSDGKDISGGVIKTTDGGSTWKQVFDERVRVNSAGLDPQKPQSIYINTFQNAAFRSEDFGESWKRIEGYRFKWGQRAVPDINNPGMLFLSTYGGSVFYGPAAGIPNASDDIENMPKGWW